MKLTLTVTCETEEGINEYEVEGNLSPYYPAKLNGPPEDCYEAEGGDFEIFEIRLDGTLIGYEDLPDAFPDEDTLSELAREEQSDLAYGDY